MLLFAAGAAAAAWLLPPETRPEGVLFVLATVTLAVAHAAAGVLELAAASRTYPLPGHDSRADVQSYTERGLGLAAIAAGALSLAVAPAAGAGLVLSGVGLRYEVELSRR